MNLFQKTTLHFDFWISKDAYGEHPEERAAKIEERTEKLGEVLTLSQVFINLKAKVNLFHDIFLFNLLIGQVWL